MRTLGFALFYLLAALGAVFLIVIGLAVVDVLGGQQHVRQAGQSCVVGVGPSVHASTVIFFGPTDQS